MKHCKYNLKCYKAKCPLIHDTFNKKSPGIKYNNPNKVKKDLGIPKTWTDLVEFNKK
jgi:hypothetical protein